MVKTDSLVSIHMGVASVTKPLKYQDVYNQVSQMIY